MTHRKVLLLLAAKSPGYKEDSAPKKIYSTLPTPLISLIARTKCRAKTFDLTRP